MKNSIIIVQIKICFEYYFIVNACYFGIGTIIDVYFVNKEGDENA